MAKALTNNEIEETFSSTKGIRLVIEGEYFIDANEEALEVLEVSSLKVFRTLHPAMISPEFQPDGESSKYKTDKLFTLLFEYGSLRFNWQHISVKRKIFDVEVSLIVKEENNIVDVHWRLI